MRQRFELPAFDALERAARKVRASLARQLHRRVHAALSPAARLRIDALFIAALATRRTPWNELKEDPGRPTRTHLKESIARERWLSARNVGTAVFSDVPAVWVEYLAHAGRNYYPFLWRAYRGYRATLFTLLSALTLRSTTQETALEEALQFPRANAGRSGR